MDMKWNDSGLKHPLARARGLGAARLGVDHWLAQKVTALSNIVLVLWALWSIIGLVGQPYDAVSAWLSQPLNAVLMILFLISTFYHALIGTTVVVEDYVHCEGRKLAALIALRFAFLGLGVAGVFSVLRVAL